MKKQLLKSALIAVAGVGLLAGSGWADPIGGALQAELNARTSGGFSSIDVTTDMLDDEYDSSWKITASSGSVATLIFELAGFKDTNSFGIYDLANRDNKILLFDGAVNAVSQVTLSYGIDPSDPGTFYSGYFRSYNSIIGKVDDGYFSSSNFGYYLQVGKTGNIWYSNTDLNTDQQDHMFAYQGVGDQFSIFLPANSFATWSPNEWILAWEDLAGPYNNVSDRDFTDFVVMVESVQPIPEPTTMLLFGTGLIGLAAVARRRKNS
jgi:hypothetical protein